VDRLCHRDVIGMPGDSLDILGDDYLRPNLVQHADNCCKQLGASIRQVAVWQSQQTDIVDAERCSRVM
jgi:hypothetical protein